MDSKYENLSFARALQDRTDLENERMGANTGRVSRFGVDKQRDIQGEAEERRKRDTERVMRDMRLFNEAYAEQFGRILEKLAKVEQAVEETLQKAMSARDAAAKQLAEIDGDAAKDPDGRAVFLDTKTDQYRYADGTAVDTLTALMIIPGDNDPTFQQREAVQERFDAVDDAVTELEDIRDNTLAPIRVDMEDGENKPSPDKLDEIESAVDAAEEAVSKATKALTVDASPEYRAQAAPTSTALPELPPGIG